MGTPRRFLWYQFRCFRGVVLKCMTVIFSKDNVIPSTSCFTRRFSQCQNIFQLRVLRLNSAQTHHYQQQKSLNREGRWGTTDDFATSFLHFSLFSTAFWDLPNSRPVHSLMLPSHLFLCPPCLLVVMVRRLY